MLERPCLPRRLPDRVAMEPAVAAGADRRNTATSTIRWPLTTADTPANLRRLYPAFDQ